MEKMLKGQKGQERYIAVAAAGTGGHIIAALCLGEVFVAEGIQVQYFAGKRHLDYNLYKGHDSIHVESLPLLVKNPLHILRSIVKNCKTLWQTGKMFYLRPPLAVVGAGGYVCGPICLAAYLLGIPVFILEQNSVMGFTNKILAFLAGKIFVQFMQTRGPWNLFREKMLLSGNPVRREFLTLLSDSAVKTNTADEFAENDVGPLKILVFGGSLGAASINDLIRDYLEYFPQLSSPIRENLGALFVKHQVGKSYLEQMNKKVSPKGQGLAFNDGLPQLQYQQLEYIEDMVQQYRWCDMVICRSGASTVSELRFVQKPVIFIPYPLHRDRHQFKNAEFLRDSVQFNVYIESCENLRVEGFKRLQEILLSVRGLKKNGKLAPRFNNTAGAEMDAAKIIASEIKQYVQEKSKY